MIQFVDGSTGSLTDAARTGTAVPFGGLNPNQVLCVLVCAIRVLICAKCAKCALKCAIHVLVYKDVLKLSLHVYVYYVP